MSVFSAPQFPHSETRNEINRTGVRWQRWNSGKWRNFSPGARSASTSQSSHLGSLSQDLIISLLMDYRSDTSKDALGGPLSAEERQMCPAELGLRPNQRGPLQPTALPSPQNPHNHLGPGNGRRPGQAQRPISNPALFRRHKTCFWGRRESTADS